MASPVTPYSKSPPEFVRWAWAVAEIVCERGTSRTETSQGGRQLAIAAYEGVTVSFENGDLVRLASGEVDLVLRRYMAQADSLLRPRYQESAFAYRFVRGDLFLLQCLARKLMRAKPSSSGGPLPPSWASDVFAA